MFMFEANLRDVLFKEIHADRLLVVFGKNALAVALNHARLSDRAIANDNHLKRGRMVRSNHK